MISSRAFCINGKVAFHIYYILGKQNSLVSTIPMPVIRKHLLKELFQLENCLVINQKMADRLLEEFSELIYKDKRFHDYFYPIYLAKHGVSFSVAEKLIHMQDNFMLKPGMCFSEKLNPVDFFYLQQRFNLNKKVILKSCKYLSMEEFTNKYVISLTAEFCFREYHKVVQCFLEFDDEMVECAGVIDSNSELKMLVSI